MESTSTPSEKPAEAEMSEEERAALFALKYESMLQAVHPMVATNVTHRVAQLLTLLDRPKLAEAWAGM